MGGSSDFKVQTAQLVVLVLQEVPKENTAVLGVPQKGDSHKGVACLGGTLEKGGWFVVSIANPKQGTLQEASVCKCVRTYGTSNKSQIGLWFPILQHGLCIEGTLGHKPWVCYNERPDICRSVLQVAAIRVSQFWEFSTNDLGDGFWLRDGCSWL